MSVLFILIGASLVVASGFLFAFIKAVKSGQYDDSFTPSVRILFDDQDSRETSVENAQDTIENNQPGL